MQKKDNKSSVSQQDNTKNSATSLKNYQSMNSPHQEQQGTCIPMRPSYFSNMDLANLETAHAQDVTKPSTIKA